MEKQYYQAMKGNKMYLTEPTPEFLPSVQSVLKSYDVSNAGFQIVRPIQALLEADKNGFDTYFTKCSDESKGLNLRPEHVPKTTYWLMDEAGFVGVVALRHRLSEALKLTGGHIAYEICPPFRGRGYATTGLKLCLQKAAELGLEKVLLTCREENVASYKTMKKVMAEYGGEEQEPVFAHDHINKRVWINTQNRKGRSNGRTI